MCQHVALYAPGALGMMLQRPRRIAEMMVDEICAFYATERPRGLGEVHIVVFQPNMMNDLKNDHPTEIRELTGNRLTEQPNQDYQSSVTEIPN